VKFIVEKPEQNLNITRTFMNRISSALVLILLILLCNNSYSQFLTGPQRRTVNEALLELINDYENYSRFTSSNTGINETYVNLFTNLFEKNALLYNDILPSNKVSDPTGIAEYIDIFRKYYPNGIGVKLHNLLFDAPLNIANNNYRINAALTKEIYGYTWTNINYTDTIPLIFTIGFQMSGNTISDMKILRISGDTRGRFMKFRVFKVITFKPVEDAEIRIDSKLSRTNSLGIASIENIDPGKTHTLTISKEPYRNIVYSNLDIDKYIEANNNNNHQRMKYGYYDPNEFIYFMNTINFIFTPILSFNIPGIKTISSEGQNSDIKLYNMKEKGSFSPRFGARIGVYLFRTPGLDLSLNAGVEKNYIRASYSFDSCHTEIMIQDGNGLYSRSIDLYDHQQKITLNFTEFPFLISVNFKRFKNFDVGADFGIRLSYLKKSNCKMKSGYSTSDLFQQSDTVIAKEYHDFVSDKKSFAYQIGLNICREIYPSLKVYASPMLFLYNNDLISNQTTKPIISSDGEINNILFTYKKSSLQYVALEFGLMYNFSSIKRKNKQ
jgi:hypothetical protein